MLVLVNFLQGVKFRNCTIITIKTPAFNQCKNLGADLKVIFQQTFQ